MAEDHLKRSASFGGGRRENPSFEEDPLVELARIVAEDGGFRRHRTPELRPAGNEPAHHGSPHREDSFASELEAELMEGLESPDRGRDLPQRPPATELRGSSAAAGQPAYVPLAPAGGGEHRQPPHFPQIVIEDARPARAAPGEQPEQGGDAEPFEEELNALFSDREGAAAGHEAAGEYAAAATHPAYEESYSAEYHGAAADRDSGYADEHFELQDEDFVAEDDEARPAAGRRAAGRGGRSYKGLIAAVGVLGIVILGGAVAAIVGGSGPGGDAAPPPVIRAEAGPAKVEPESTGEARAENGAGQVVYDSVAGRAPKSEEQLVDRAEEPQQVSRVVLPQTEAGSQTGQAADAGATGEAAPGDGPADRAAAGSPADAASSEERIAGQISSETASMQSGPRIDPVGPRRVRTVTVRPDGSIVSTPGPVRVAESAAQPLGEIEADFSGADAPEPVPVRTVTIDGDGAALSRPLTPQADAPPAGSAAEPPALAPATDSRAAGSQPQAASGGTAQPGAEEAAEQASPPEAEIAMLPRARPDEVPAAFTRPAAARSEAPTATPPRRDEPVNLLAAAPASPRSQAPPPQAAPPASPAASSPYAVQLSSQRSEDQARAAFASLRNQFPSVLGSHEANIQRADLGERGIYYRVRVGAGSQAEAVQLCEQLKAAGGSCFVAR